MANQNRERQRRRRRLFMEALEVRAMLSQLQASLSLDGIDDRVRVAHDSSLNLVARSAATLEAWVRLDETAGCQGIVTKDSYSLELCDGRLEFMGGVGNRQIPPNVWTHVAVVWQGGGTQAFYINGELDHTRPAGSSRIAAADRSNLHLGGSTGSVFQPTSNTLAGNLSEVRLWNTVRTRDELLQTMHVAVEERLPNLVAAWHLSDDYRDTIGNREGTPLDGASRSDPQPPVSWSVVPIDTNVNSLAQPLHSAALVHVPGSNQAISIGGVDLGRSRDWVTRIDPGTGTSEALAALPAPRGLPAAVYVPSTAERPADSIFVFGGYDSRNESSSDIMRLNSDGSGAAILTDELSVPIVAAQAVYHPGVDRVLILGGRRTLVANDSDPAITIFDPNSQTVQARIVEPLMGRSDHTAVYSTLTGKIYVFGGGKDLNFSDEVLELTVTTDSAGAPLIETRLIGRLPQAQADAAAVEDPHTKLIYLIGGGANQGVTRVWAFDPRVPQVFVTPIEHPRMTESDEESRPDWFWNPSAVYDPVNRHILVIGGVRKDRDIWRIPLGDGPATPLGRWDTPASAIADPDPESGFLPIAYPVSSIHGAQNRVLVGTSGGGAFAYDGDGSKTHYTAATLGSGNVQGVFYDAARDRSWIATDAGVTLAVGDSALLLGDWRFGATSILDVHGDPRGNIFLGTEGGGLAGLFFASSGNGSLTSSDSTLAGMNITAIDDRGFGELWVLNNSGKLYRVRYNESEFLDFVDFDFRCDTRSDDLAVTREGERWLVANPEVGEFGDPGVCRDLATDPPSLVDRPLLTSGVAASEVSIDADGRIWVAALAQSGDGGGVLAYEVVNPELVGEAGVRSTDFDWLSAPIGSGQLVATQTEWVSGFSSVGAVEERVWLGKGLGRLATIAPRWQQLDRNNDLDQKVVEHVWTAGGRLFTATSNSLHVLLPDGRTWDNRPGVSAHAVLQDSQGNLWVGTSTGPKLYLDDGWDPLESRLGIRPSSDVWAIAEDSSGRVWLGGANGLTLFDRGRFVATIDDATAILPEGPVTTLLVDRTQHLWVGTPNGLARIDLTPDGVGESLLFRRPDGAPWSGLGSNSIADLAELPDGQVVVSTSVGLSVFNGVEFVRDFEIPIPATNLPLSVDDQGQLWAGSAVQANGVWRGYYETNSGLRSSQISDHASDGAGRVWFSHAPDTGVSVRGSYLPPLSQEILFASSFSPHVGHAGSAIHIVGSGFGDQAWEIDITVGGSPIPSANIVSVADGLIVFTLTAETLSGKVVVQRRGQTSEVPGTFLAEPVIERLTPTGGSAGVVVEIFGTNIEPGAMISLGGGVFRPLTLVENQQRHDPTFVRATILPGDGVGRVVVRNGAGREDIFESTEFRKIDVDVAEVVLNQGILGNGLVNNKPTLFQHYLVHETTPRVGDRIEVDRIATTFSAPDGSWSVGPYNRELPAPDSQRLTHETPFDPVLFETIDESLNLMIEPRLPDEYRGGPVLVTTELLRHDQPVAPPLTHEQRFVDDHTLRVLLVPIMHDNYTSADLATVKRDADINLSQVRDRLWPLGDVQTTWAWDILTPDELIDDPLDLDGKINIGSRLNFYDASHELDAIRRSYNDNSRIKFDSVYGVVENDSRILDGAGGANGMAVTPEYDLLNDVVLTRLDAICDVAAVGLAILSLGFAGDADGCSLEIPQRVAWGLHNADASTYAQEIGHNFGLVALNTFNLNVFDSDNNLAHSGVDEILNGDCSGGLTDDERLDRRLTLYANQPGVFGPIVNPLLNAQPLASSVLVPLGQQFLNNFGTPSFSSDSLGTTRAKSVMSYACRTNSDNVFFEPVDTAYLRSTLLRDTNSLDEAVDFVARTGLRFLITGEIDEASEVGAISGVSALTNAAAPDLNYRSAYELVQFDRHGIELGRTGIVPSFTVTHHFDGEVPGEGDEHGDGSRGYFATTLAGLPGVARIELRHHEHVLDAFEAGAAPPAASVEVFPTSTSDGPAVAVAWTASDPDGDEVSTTLLVSVDDGDTWTPFASRSASGSERLPLELFPGSSAARVQVVASDGFQRASAISASFAIDAKAPTPYIAGPTDDAQLVEGQAIILRGGAEDLQDGWLDDSRLSWSSDRDGLLGMGRTLASSLTAGTHELTMRAVNSLGLAASTSLVVHVVGDYDADGIPDDAESALGLSALRSALLAPDTDGDGLSLIAELRHGTDPSGVDTDGDGVNDGDELRRRSDPFAADEPIVPDALAVFPTQIELTVDLADDVRFPQTPFFVLSQLPAEFTVASDADWLQLSSPSGITPATTIVLARATNLDDGVHRTFLTVTSPKFPHPVRVPVTVTVEHVSAALDADGDGQLTWDDANWIEAGVGFTVGDDGYEFARDVDRDGDVDSNDIGLARTRFISACLTVTNTADDGPGSLRMVIECSNTLPEPGEIRFRIPATDPNFVDVDQQLEGGDLEPDVFVIKPRAPLPALTRGRIVVNGQSQLSLTGDTNPFGPEIVLDGISAGPAVNGLELRSSGNRLHGLNIQRFAGHGVLIAGNVNQVTGSYLGTNSTGTTPFSGVEGLAGWWPGEGSAVDVVEDHDGALAFDATFAPGLVGQAFRLDGVDDRVEIPAANQITLTAGLTLEAWIQTTSDDSSSTYAGNAALNVFGNSTNNVWVGFGVHDGKARYNFATGPSNWTHLDGTTIVNDGAWHHLAATHDETTGGVSIYVDGRLEASSVFNYHAIDPYGVPVAIDRIGAGYSSRDGFEGLIDEPAVFGRPLSSAEVESIYRRGSMGKSPENPANGGSGVVIDHGDGNTIGGPATSLRNLISGNAQYGVLIVGNSATPVPPDYDGPPIFTDNPADLGGRGNIVVGNYIGLGADGDVELGNRWSGVFVRDSANNQIGQGYPLAGNVISANRNTGVFLSGEASFGNRLQGNYIGTDALGESARGNREIGVQTNYGARYNLLGVDGNGSGDELEGNVISGHTHLPQDSGVWLGIGHHNVVAGNLIGTDWTGRRAIPNDVAIDVRGHGNRIGSNVDGVSDTFERNVISGNIVTGILIIGDDSTGTVVQGNFVGVDNSGTQPLGNGVYGIVLSNTHDNRIGGSQSSSVPVYEGDLAHYEGDSVQLPVPPTAGNVISGNGTDGIHLDYSHKNVIQGNRIGVDYLGLQAMGNGRFGIYLGESAQNLIGGGEVDAGNVISDNLNGIGIYYEASVGNKVQGNYIGVNAWGSGLLPNRGWGIDATYNVSFNVIGVDGDGVDDATEGNVISGHRGFGQPSAAVYLVGHDNVIAGNLLGTDATGRQAMGNVYGIHMGGYRNRVGTDGDNRSDALERNVIADNDMGVSIFSGADNVVAGNFIGTDITGNRALGNGGGIGIERDVLRTRIGTNADGVSDELERNIVSGQGGIAGTASLGIGIGGIDTVVAGNYIGLGANGTTVLGNASHGVYVTNSAIGTQIGGVLEAERNVIAGNGGDQVVLAGTLDTRVQGNYIGVDPTGTLAVSYAQVGIRVADDRGSLIGGAAPGAGNVISGSFYGIYVNGSPTYGGTQGLHIQGNKIGTDHSGQEIIANFQGIELDGQAGFLMHDILIGGTEPDAGNLISGNQNGGIIVRGPNVTDVRIQGNKIGTDLDGYKLLANGQAGLRIDNASGVRVGGAGDGAGNQIVGGYNSVWISGPAAVGNVIQGNLIGVNHDGSAAITPAWLTSGLSERGILIHDGASHTTIGGLDAGAENVIAGYFGAAIDIYGGGDNQIVGNRVGTNANGDGPIGNGRGVVLNDSPGNQLIGNVVSGQITSGVVVSGSHSTGTTIRGNRIGMNLAGTAAIPNAWYGINLVGGPEGAVIGGTTEADRNLVSANGGDGIRLEGRNHRVLGNSIGTDTAGTGNFGNGSAGVYLADATDVWVGSGVDGAGNLIAGNVVGVMVLGVPVDGQIRQSNVRVQGNRMGTTADGLGAIGNAYGVRITASGGNFVGADGDGVDDGTEGNLISGNTIGQVDIFSDLTEGNVIAGNWIGLDATGRAAINGGGGVSIINGAGKNRVGTDADGRSDDLERNLISGRTGTAVYLENTYENVVAGNFIGTDVDGEVALLGSDFSLNHSVGIHLSRGAHHNTIGGATVAARNIISGHANGVLLSDAATTDNAILGNFLGTDVDGQTRLPNLDSITIVAASGNRFGGSATGEGNLISGSARFAIHSSSADGNTIQGNWIGTDAYGNGNPAVWNAHGIYLYSDQNSQIGGSEPDAGNVIAGAGWGIWLGGLDGPTKGVRIQGNRIGTTANGQQAWGNAWGIYVEGNDGHQVDDLLIGGPQPGARNLISGNALHGVVVTGLGAHGVRIQGNALGTNDDGSEALSNAQHGVLINNARRVLVGTDGDGVDDETEGNVVAFNGADGVAVVGDASRDNTIRRNSLHSNGNLGIDLADDGVTANDKGNATVTPVIPPDTDGGPNLRQNFPDISSSRKTTSGANAGLTVTGVLKSTPNTTFVIDLYRNDVAGRSGRTWLASLEKTTDGQGSTSFSFSMPLTVADVGDYLTATATEVLSRVGGQITGNTSEFSAPNQVTGGGSGGGGNGGGGNGGGGNGGGGGRPLVAAELPASPITVSLTQTQLTPLVQESLTRWQAAGVRVPAAEQINVGITDLPGSLLGLAHGHSIWLDDNAAGWGWFVDATPSEDSEFLLDGNQGEQRRMDLLTVVMHELGHLLGYDHGEEGLMAERMAIGVRHTELEHDDGALVDQVFGLASDHRAYGWLGAWLHEQFDSAQGRAKRRR